MQQFSSLYSSRKNIFVLLMMYFSVFIVLRAYIYINFMHFVNLCYCFWGIFSSLYKSLLIYRIISLFWSNHLVSLLRLLAMCCRSNVHTTLDLACFVIPAIFRHYYFCRRVLSWWPFFHMNFSWGWTCHFVPGNSTPWAPSRHDLFAHGDRVSRRSLLDGSLLFGSWIWDHPIRLGS